MALRLSLRRALSLSAALLSHTRFTTTPTISSVAATTSALINRDFRPRSFSSASRSITDNDGFDPNGVLFEGCDYKHWLIVMDFGKDPQQRPPPDQMVETYVQTCAQVVGSVEEAKRRIYACSTTTYTGFQVEVDEEISKKFDGLPGVIFVLPDSYIDPANKEYGGDKYINGEIIPRPPPVQYGRTGRGFRPNNQRPRDPMHNQQGNPGHTRMPQDGRGFTPQGPQQGFPNQQGNPAYNQQGTMPQDRRGYTPQGPQQGFPQQQSFPSQQNYPPRQDYGPSGQADRGASLPGGTPNPAAGRDGNQRFYVPPRQGNHNPDYNQQQSQMGNPLGTHGGYAPPGQYQSGSGDRGYNHPQGQRGHLSGDHGAYPPPGQMGFSGGNRSNSPPPVTGTYGQTGAGPFEQSRTGQFGHGPSGSYGQGAGYTPHAANQSFPPTSNEQIDPVEHRNYPPGTQTGFNQGR